jgi:GNAT superfamily N-acetyltransferase
MRPHGGTPATRRLIARDIRCTLRRRGPRAALAVVGHIARHRVYVTVHELIIARELGLAHSAPARSALRVEAAGERHLPVVAEFHRARCMTRRTPLFAAALAQGVRGTLGFVGDELVGYMWWVDARQAAQGCYLSRFAVQLRPDDVFGYNLFIAPEHRGRGTAVGFLDRAEAELARQGYRRIIGTVDTANVPARWLHETRGYEVLQCSTTRVVLHALVIVDGRPFLARRGGLRPLWRDTARGAPPPPLPGAGGLAGDGTGAGGL